MIAVSTLKAHYQFKPSQLIINAIENMYLTVGVGTMALKSPLDVNWTFYAFELWTEGGS